MQFLRIQNFILATMIMGIATMSAIQPAQAQDFNAGQTQAIEGIVKDYLMKNPQVIFESIDAFRTQREEEERKQAVDAIENNLKNLTSAQAPSIGPADADVTIVEFFDYNCGYCKRALPDVQAVIDKDPKVRVVFKEMPILGPTSFTAAQWALAARKQDKYFEYHAALMEHRGPKEEPQLTKIAKDLGLDVEKMKTDANSDDVQKQIADDVELARLIGINGTPAFIVGKTLYPGYIGEEGLFDAIAQARNDKEDG